MMLQDLKTLYKYRELLWIWTVRIVKVKYKQSVLGIAWAVLQPLSLMIIFSVVFSLFIKVETGNIPYPAFSYCALLPWTFLSTSSSFGTNSLTSNMNLITKIYFPREVLPVSFVIASLLDYAIGWVVYIGMLVFYKIPINETMLFIPVILLIQIALTLGVVLFISASNVFFRDIQFIVPLGMMLWMYATPIIYPLSLVPEGLRPLYLINPMATLVEAYRSITLQGMLPDWSSLALAAGISVAIMIAGFAFFKKVEWQFADII